MVKCFAPGCTSGHTNLKEKVYLFKPSTKEIVVKWAQMFPRLDRTFGENDYLCAKHFDKKDIIYEESLDNLLQLRMQPKLVKNAIPKFFSIPEQVSNTEKQPTVIDNTFVKKTRRTCAACNCSENFQNGRKISYYLFPINPELRKQWISAAQLKNSNLSQFAYLCSKHFEENCFDSVSLGTLKEDAVPSRFGFTMISSSSICPTSSTSDTESNIIDLTETNSKSYSSEINSSIPFCIVKSCKHEGNIRGITYHRIPKNNYDNWMNVLKNYTKVDPIPCDSRVCSMHFKAKDFLIQGNKIKLNNEAVPKLHINAHLINEASNIIATNPLSNHETEQESAVIFNDESGVKKLKQTVLLTSVITPAADIVKSDFALIDINSIINKKIENELNNTRTITQNKSNSTKNLTIIKAMHNYCNDQLSNEVLNIDDTPVVNVEKQKKVQMETTKSIANRFPFINKNTTSDENDNEDKKKKNIIRKLRAYKKAYKKHKSINRKQSDNILILENKLEENTKKNKKLEQRIVILEDLIQNMLRKREENIIDMDNFENS